MSYDQGYWHTDGCADAGIEEECAGTHIAVYIKWCANSGLLNESWLDTDENVLKKLIDGSISANYFFQHYLDWKFGEWNLNEVGNAFSKSYYNAKYGDDYYENSSATLSENNYIHEKEVNFSKLSKIIDSRFYEFKKYGSQGVSWYEKPIPWWKFW